MPKFNTGERQINIKVKMNNSIRNNIESIRNLMVPGKNGLIPLKSVADISFSGGPVQINRYDRTRQVTISANLNGIALGEAIELINRLPVIKNLPDEVSIGKLGEAKLMEDFFNETVKVVVPSVMFIYTVLALLFGSFLYPLTIMVALPLSIGGAMLALLITGKQLGIMALIGIIMLLGIVTKNSILLVEYAIISQKSGRSRSEAILLAGMYRLKPIIMTTIAMISGMLPIALSIGTGTAPQSPMAVVVIGGLISSTLFTLVVVPAIYCIIDDFQKFMLGFFRKKSRLEKKT